MFRSCVKIDSIDMLKFTHTSFNLFGFWFNWFRFSYIWFSWIDRIKTSLHGLMYIRFDLYTSMLHLSRKTYFKDPIHVFGVLNLTQNLFLDFMSKT